MRSSKAFSIAQLPAFKACTKCRATKSQEFFKILTNSDGGFSLNSWCKPCCYKCQDEWAKKNPERRKAIVKKHLATGKGKIRQRKYFFGITEDQYQGMRAAQNYVCAICRVLKDETLCVDHDHLTEKIRGLLCRHCNSVLGLAKDDVEILSRAIEYLKESSEN